MTNRKFYKTAITIEVLSEYPIPESMELLDIIYESTEGGLSRSVVSEKETVLTGKEMADALIKQGSDPEFFELTEDGDDLGEDAEIQRRDEKNGLYGGKEDVAN